MEESLPLDSINLIRVKNQSDISSQRQKSRETALSTSRINSMPAKITSDLCINQIKKLSLEISQKKKFDLQILKKIKNACCRSEFIEAFFKIDGAFEAILNCLKQNDGQLQIEAVACLTNLACGPHKVCFKVAKAAGAYLVSFLSSGSHFLQSQSAWAVRNIVNDCTECYNKLNAHGVYPALLKALKSSIPDVVESAVYALSACSEYVNNLNNYNKENHIIILLNLTEEKKLSSSTTREIAFILAKSLSVSINNVEDYTNVDQFLRCIRKYLCDENGDYLTALVLIRCLGYLTTLDWIVEYLLTNPCFTEITVDVLNHPCLFLKKEFFWILTNTSVSEILNVNLMVHTLILKTLEVLLNPLDPAIFMILYYICCTATQSKSMYSSYKQQGLLERIENFTNCGISEVENASKSCLDVIKIYFAS